MRIHLRDIGRLFGKEIPAAGKKGFCPFQKHRRDDKTFRVFEGKQDGGEVYKCWSCDPPDNAGNAITLYARLADVDTKEAFARLKELGYEIGDRRYEAPKRETPLKGREIEIPILLEADYVSRRKADPHAEDLARYWLNKRGLDEAVALPHMVGLPDAMHGGAVGFVYKGYDDKPCRIKARGVSEKRFFVIPKKRKGTDERALSPLYLAETLRPTGRAAVAFVTEGEVDALSLVSLGFPNVVSLPDGSESVKTCDLSPLLPFSAWILSFDDDEPGKEAARFLDKRARRYGIDAVPILWSRTTDTGEVERFKDANDALMAGMDREAFGGLVDRLLERRYGHALPWRRAA